MKEVWKDIKGYEGLYQVSNLGRVKSLERKIESKIIDNYVKKEKILKINKSSKYYTILLCNNGKRKNIPIHRLVAETFISNPNNLPCINHRDEIKANNNVNNLEWCTYKYNSNYGNSKWITGKKHWKKVLQYDKNGKLIKEWESLSQISKILKTSISNISACCHQKQKTSNGYIWKFKDGE